MALVARCFACTCSYTYLGGECFFFWMYFQLSLWQIPQLRMRRLVQHAPVSTMVDTCRTVLRRNTEEEC